jgi:hypothetical protein
MGRVAETYGKSIGLSEFKLTTPLRQGTAVLLHFDMCAASLCVCKVECAYDGTPKTEGSLTLHNCADP